MTALHEVTPERDAYETRWACTCGWVGEWAAPGTAGAEAVRHVTQEGKR